MEGLRKTERSYTCNMFQTLEGTFSTSFLYAMVLLCDVKKVHQKIQNTDKFVFEIIVHMVECCGPTDTENYK